MVALLLLGGCAYSQQTVLNVPSADVLARGKAYFELDSTIHARPYASMWEPRLVFGMGHNIETGINVTGIDHPGQSSTTFSPTFKWNVKRWPQGWSLLVGDNLFFPLQDRRSEVGNYFYAETAKVFRSSTRVTLGVYHFTAHVTASGQRAGGQFAIEQPIHKRANLIADWFTGDHANGYLSVGALLKVTPRLTLYPAYMIGNHRVREGNHQFEFELGWNLN